ncbi:MAG: hypothetical protein PGN11_08760 [Quadrisphaera sp.]
MLRARGAGDEAGIPHALLHQVLSPLLAELGDDLDQTRRDALEVAVGVRAPHEGAVPVPLAALGALEVLARRRPVLVVVDDAHLADPDSAAALRFLGRRLSRTAACLVLAHPGPGGPLPTAPADVATRLRRRGARAGAPRRRGRHGLGGPGAVVARPGAARRAPAPGGRPAPPPGRPAAAGGPGRGCLGAGRRGPHRAARVGAARRGRGAPGAAARRRADRPAARGPGPARRAGRRAAGGPGRRGVGAASPGVDGAGATAAALDPLVAALAAEEADGALVAELRTAWAQHLGEAAAAATAGTAVATRLQAEALRQRALADPAGAPRPGRSPGVRRARAARRGRRAQRRGLRPGRRAPHRRRGARRRGGPRGRAGARQRAPGAGPGARGARFRPRGRRRRCSPCGDRQVERSDRPPER